MRIVVNDFAASVGGATSILQSFYNYLIESGDENEWFFLLSDKYIKETNRIHVILLQDEKKSRIRRLMFDLVYGRKLIKKINPDAVFYLQNTFIHGVRAPQIAYMDQPIPFQTVCKFSFRSPEQRPYAIYQFIIGHFIKNACKAADRIIVQTEWMREAISEQCNISLNKIEKIPPDICEIEKSNSSEFNRKHFFYPASMTYYKNHRCIKEAVNAMPASEKVGLQIDFTISSKEESEFQNKEIRCIGSIPHSEVMKRYASETLIFPSYVETYGLPLAEARLSGGMILAADTPFSREILDGYVNAYFFDPFQPEQLAALIKRVYTGDIEKTNVDETQLLNSRQSGWERVVECIQNVAVK